MLNILMIVQQDAVQCTEHTAWFNQRNVGLVKCTSIDIGRNVYFCVNCHQKLQFCPELSCCKSLSLALFQV